jgi:hypothetical protein
MKITLYGLEKYFWKSAAVVNVLKNSFKNLFEKKSNHELKINKELIDRIDYEKKINKSVEYFVNNERIINKICLEFKIDCYFFLQPYLFTKKTPTSFEEKLLFNEDKNTLDWHSQYYDKVLEKKKNYKHFDLSKALNDSHDYPDYYDWIHLGPKSSEVIGKKIFNSINN